MCYRRGGGTRGTEPRAPVHISERFSARTGRTLTHTLCSAGHPGLILGTGRQTTAASKVAMNVHGAELFVLTGRRDCRLAPAEELGANENNRELIAVVM